MIIERLLEKRAKKVTMDMGEGATYTFDDSIPNAKEYAKELKDVRQPYGVGRAMLSGIVPSVLSALLGGGGSFLINRLAFDTDPKEAFHQALLIGGTSGALTFPLAAALNYGKRVPMKSAVDALNAAYAARAGKGPFDKSYVPEGFGKVTE